MKNSASRRTVLTAAIAAVLAFGVLAEASAQAAARAQERRARAEQQRDHRCFRAISAQVPVGSISRYLRQHGFALSTWPVCSYAMARLK